MALTEEKAFDEYTKRRLAPHNHDWPITTSRDLNAYGRTFKDFFKEGTTIRDQFKPGMKVLDIGCGAGRAVYDIAEYIAGNGGKVIGVDYTSASFLSEEEYEEILRRTDGNSFGAIWKSLEQFQAERRYRDFRVLDAKKLPWPDNSFDLIFCLQVLPYFPNKIPLLKEIVRLLKKGGTCYLFTYAIGGAIIETSKMTQENATSMANKYESVEDVFNTIRRDYDPNAKEYTVKNFLETYSNNVHVQEKMYSWNNNAYKIKKKSENINTEVPWPSYFSFIPVYLQEEYNVTGTTTLVRPPQKSKQSKISNG